MKDKKAPRMTRAHFELIAEAVFNTELPYQTRKNIAYALAASFAATNPNFKLNKFIEACGV